MRCLVWLRRELRLRDNRALAAAARGAENLTCVYVVDMRLLRGSRSSPARSRFLLDGLARLARDLDRRGQRLLVRTGRPERVLPRLVHEGRFARVHWSRDVGPFARARDDAARIACEKAGAQVETHSDRVVFESHEIRTRQGGAYAVYTPYRNAWQERWAQDPPLPERSPRLPPPPPGLAAGDVPDADALGIRAPIDLPTSGEAAARRRLRAFLDGGVADYGARRDLPGVDGTSRLSPYLRFGMVSARECVAEAFERIAADPRAARGARKWIDELVWREFYSAVLAEHPRVLRESHRPEYDALAWDDDEERFAAWCEGRTGYPIIDAGMRQLVATGWMHNRARMLVASFLTKDLLLDWRWGERFFQQHLLDGDPASNNGGWQWAASTGTDAQPYFRIFNPTRQGERFDPDGAYVRRWVPELRALPDDAVHRPWERPALAGGYPAPLVDHAVQRMEALRRYEAARG
jgi:deoxyribodipyrimidine photo-lyase